MKIVRWMSGGVLAMLAGSVNADIINVPGDQPTIQAAINAAINGDEIVVADGIYVGAGNKNLDYHGREITVRSENGPDKCIIDCEGAGRGFTFQSGETAAAIVDGFTIRNGFDGGLFGAGMSIFASSPTIIRCRFISNDADGKGGGMSNQSSSNPTVIECTFETNEAPDGGGIYNSSDSVPDIVDCSFVGNSASRGGGIYLGGGGTLTGCVFTDNSADTHNGGGGGIYVIGSALLTNCSFNSNSAASAINGLGGGVRGGDLVAVNCTFSGNFAGFGAAGMLVGDGILLNCVFSGNLSGGNGAAGLSGGDTITNCVFWGNGNQGGNSQGAQLGSGGVINYTCVQGWTGELGGIGNIGSNPLFVDPNGPDGLPGGGDDDLRLLPGSPCIDAAHNWAIAGHTDIDLDGNPRFADDPATADTGCGTPVQVDMGAYEFQGNPFDVKLGDLDGDGLVSTADLLTLLGAWGDETKGCLLADLDLDGVVGTSDLLILLSNWG